MGIVSEMHKGTAPRTVRWRRLLSAWLPALGCAGLIFIASATPDLRFLPDASLDLVVRKLGHMGVFGILALLLRPVPCSPW